MKNELSKEDQERIQKAALYQVPIIGELYFRQGAKYEHPIAKKEGFNEAIEEVAELIKARYPFKIGEYEYCTLNVKLFFQEIEKLKR